MTDAQKKIIKAKTDIAQCFLVYMSLAGDIEKTSAALDLEPEFVQWVADEEGWTAKIKRVSLMAKGEKDGSFERSVNRAMVFCQAHQMRGIVDRMLSEIRGQTIGELLDKTSTVDKYGHTHYSAKFFLDLSSAIETCARVSFVALADSVTERVERDEASESGNQTVAALHQSIIAALNNPSLGKETSDALVREQAATVRRLVDRTNETPQHIVVASECRVVPDAPSESPDLNPLKPLPTGEIDCQTLLDSTHPDGK